MRTRLTLAALAVPFCLSLVAALAGPQSVVEFSFSENGVTTAYSAAYTPGSDISFSETYGGYTLLISAVSDNLYGLSSEGIDPFLSFTIQVSNVGANPPPSITIGMSLTGLTSSPGSVYGIDSTGTAIFHTTSTAGYSTFYDPTNTLFGTGDALSSFLLSKTGSAEDQSLLERIGSTYSLSQFFTLTPVAFAHPTLDGELEVTSVPEPASLALLGAGVIGLGLTRNAKRGKKATAA